MASYPLAIKDTSVHAHGMTPQLSFALTVAGFVFSSRGVPCLVTSLNDGNHGAKSTRHPRSLHYEGRAADLRLPSRYTGTTATDNDTGLASVDRYGRKVARTFDNDLVDDGTGFKLFLNCFSHFDVFR